MVLVACSGGGDGGDGGAGGEPATTGAAGAGPDGSVAGVGTDGTPTGEVRSPESFAEYYRKLGVAEPVVTCYVGALTDLGVTSLDQLEADQALGARAADRFDQCVVSGAGGAQTPTT